MTSLAELGESTVEDYYHHQNALSPCVKLSKNKVTENILRDLHRVTYTINVHKIQYCLN